MHISHTRVGAAVLLVLVVSASAAQGQQVIIEGPQTAEPMIIPGLGPRGQQMKTGTGRIAGRILSAETGAPLRRAQVRVTAPEIGAKTALTDGEGRYEFRDLPAGRFTLNASKSGYVTVQYGQTRPFESGRAIELAEKESLDRADITMPRGGVISGRIVDEFGDPVPDAMVSSMRQAWLNGRRRLQATGRGAQTNDLGQFRLYGLPPGEYYVSATLRNSEMLALEAAFVGAGASATSGSQPASGYAPTYYPGTTSATNAQRVTVSVGQEAQSTDFALAPVRLARITGVVMSSDGKPLEGAVVSATSANRSGEAGIAMLGLGAMGRTSKDGTFTINSVAPGDYTLTVRSVRIMTASEGGNTMFRMMTGGAEGDSETASLPVVVTGEDLTNVLIVTSKGGTATGRVTFEGGARPAAASVRISAVAPEMDGPALGPAAGQVKEDGSFELKGLSGRRLIRAMNLPTGWTLKSVRLEGEDITDTGAEFKPGQEVSELEIVATTKSTTITGSVASGNGTLVKDYTVVVFSTDAQQWNLPMTRWVTGTRPDQEGRFRIRNMPAGSYYAVAVDYVEQGSWGDPDLLERLKARAKQFTLTDGETETLELKITDAS